MSDGAFTRERGLDRGHGRDRSRACARRDRGHAFQSSERVSGRHLAACHDRALPCLCPGHACTTAGATSARGSNPASHNQLTQAKTLV